MDFTLEIDHLIRPTGRIVSQGRLSKLIVGVQFGEDLVCCDTLAQGFEWGCKFWLALSKSMGYSNPPITSTSETLKCPFPRGLPSLQFCAREGERTASVA
jgi:hypothetical protein